MTPRDDQPHVLDHSYDGIEEYDNPMPRWWLALFAATIVFIPVYYLAPGDIGAGEKKDAMYAKEVAEFKAAHPDAGAATLTAADLDRIIADPAKVAEGRTVFASYCAACHRADGGGLIGPNLTDDFWIHGGTPVEIRTTIYNGVLDKGMPAWGKMLKPDQVDAVTAYVHSIHGSNPASPRTPEGTKTNPDGTPAATGGTR